MAGEFQIAVELEGLDDLRTKLKSKTAAAPARRFLQRVGDDVIAKAKPLTPVNVGTLRRSIDKEVSSETPVPTWVKVGTNVEYAPFVEFGREPGDRPPYRAIDWWYRRKKSLGPDADVFAAVTAIQDKIERVGIKEKPYLRDGFQAAVPNIQKRVYTLATEIEEAYRRGSQ